MNPTSFVYWLQGMFEGKSSLAPDVQIKMINEHLALVLTKVTSEANPPQYIPFVHQDSSPIHVPNFFNPICSTGTGPRGPIINNCTTAPTLADMGWTGDSTASTLNGNGTTTISINNPNGLECNSDSTTPKSGEYHILNSLSKLRKSDILC